MGNPLEGSFVDIAEWCRNYRYNFKRLRSVAYWHTSAFDKARKEIGRRAFKMEEDTIIESCSQELKGLLRSGHQASKVIMED